MNLLHFEKAFYHLRPPDRLTRLSAVAAVFTCILVTAGCDTTASIADFSKSSQATLASGSLIFADLSATCGREINNHKLPGEFGTADELPKECQAIGKQADGMAAASKVVYQYFDALNSLASFNTAKTSGNVGQLVSDAGELAKLSDDRKNALSGLAQIITQITTSSYQAKHLRDDIVTVDPHLKAVLSALQQTVNGPGMYLDMLTKEEQSLANGSREFLLLHPNSPEATIALDQQWKADRIKLAARKQSAQAYVIALGKIGDGHHELAQQAGTTNPKEVLAILEPYVDEITSLIPTIRKAFI